MIIPYKDILHYLMKTEGLSEDSANSYISYIKRIDGFELNVQDPADHREAQKRVATFPKKSQQNTMTALQALSRYRGD